MNVGIIGGGSIGLLISSYLSIEHNVCLYVRRNEQKQKLNKYGLFLSGIVDPLPMRALLTEEMEKEDCLIICVKQAHIPSVLSTISTGNEQTPLIFLQNGMSHIDLIRNKTQPVLIGVTEHGAIRVNDQTVQHTGKGRIKLASFLNRGFHFKELTCELNQANFPFDMTEDWSQLLAEKVIVNAVINPLTALFNIRNGDLVTNGYLNKLAKDLCEEAALVLDLDVSVQWNRVEEIARKTGANISSMLKDIKENQKTEIEAISGYIISIADIPVPNTLFVYNSIKALEEKKGI